MQTPASSAPLAILVPGKVLLDFVQTGFETKHDQVVVSGTLTVSDRTDFRNPKNIPFTWFAVRDTVRGEFTTDWIFGKNANVPGFDAKNPGLDKALTKHVQDHVEKVWLAHAVASAVVATPVPVEGAPVAPEPVDPAAPISPVPDTSFPPDWSIRAAVAHPIAPKPPKAPRPPKPPKPPKAGKPASLAASSSRCAPISWSSSFSSLPICPSHS